MSKYRVRDLKPGDVVTLEGHYIATKARVVAAPDVDGDVKLEILEMSPDLPTQSAYRLGEPFYLFVKEDRYIVNVERPGENVRRVVLSNGTTTLPEATLLKEDGPSGWSVRFDGSEGVNDFRPSAGWTAQIIEPPRELPTEPWTVIRFPGHIPFILDDFQNWRDPFGNKVDLNGYRGDWVELTPRGE